MADGQGQVTIRNDDGSSPRLSIGDVTVTEDDTTAVFTVGLSPVSSQAVSVTFATADGTASAGADYVATTGTLTIPPGASSGTVAVPVLEDSVPEADETFLVNLSAAGNATIADNQAVGTITDDDTNIPSLSIDDASLVEADQNCVFTVRLSAPSAQAVNVSFATANGGAVTPSDYTATSGTLVLPPGAGSGTIAVMVHADQVVEPDEIFVVTLSAPLNAVIADGVGVCTIIDDDVAPTTTTTSTTVPPTTSTTVPPTTTTTVPPTTTTTTVPPTTTTTTVPPTTTTTTVPPRRPGGATSGPTSTSTSTTTSSTTSTTTSSTTTTSTTVPEPPPPPEPGPDDVAALELDRSSAPPGREAVATGQGCRPGDEVVLSIEGAEVGRAVADAEGVFQAQITIPDGALGSLPLLARCGGLALESSIDVVLTTAAGGAGSGAVAAVLCSFVLVGLLIFRSPQDDQ
ncbi:MAG: Calx-beta domain-containing protein [Acidimicrobiales bacterium]